MSHTSGLPAHREYFRGLGASVLRTGAFERARSALRRMLGATTPVAAPGERELYSDLGYLLLEAICEGVDAPLTAVWPTLLRPWSRRFALPPARQSDARTRPALRGDRAVPVARALVAGRGA
jgi:CubicO group peptidase (beta-lactamase class C family)